MVTNILFLLVVFTISWLSNGQTQSDSTLESDGITSETVEHKKQEI